MSNESGRMEIYVRPFAHPSARGVGLTEVSGQWQISTTGGINPRWRGDGRELYFLAPNGAIMAATITVSGSALTPGAPVPLFRTRIVGGGTENNQGRQYDVSRDGRFLVNTVLGDTSSPITLVQNWHPEAKK
jgi:hypothetical protein